MIVFFFIWLCCGLLEYCFAGTGYGRWIELLNGATWPDYFSTPEHPEHRGFWFFVFLSLRTVLNLGITATAAYGLYFFTGPGRLLMKNLRSALAVQNDALAAVILKVLEDNQTKLTPSAVDAVYAAVEKFGEQGYFPEQVLRAGAAQNHDGISAS